MKNKLSINSEVSLVEIILSVIIFAFAGVIILNLFSIARYTQIKANDKVIAGSIVQSNVEIIEASENLNKMHEFMLNNYTLVQEENSSHFYVNYYSKSWDLCSEKEKVYLITVKISDAKTKSGALETISITAERSEPYPFINKNDQKKNIVYHINTKKFFPVTNGGI